MVKAFLDTEVHDIDLAGVVLVPECGKELEFFKVQGIALKRCCWLSSIRLMNFDIVSTQMYPWKVHFSFAIMRGT